MGQATTCEIGFPFSGRLKGQEGEPWATSCWPGFELYRGRDSTYLFFHKVIKIYPITTKIPVHNCLSPPVTKPGSPSPFTKPRPYSQVGRPSNTPPASHRKACAHFPREVAKGVPDSQVFPPGGTRFPPWLNDSQWGGCCCSVPRGVAWWGSLSL